MTELRRVVRIDAPDAMLDGDLVIPTGARGVVLFAHGSGSSRFSPRNRRIAEALQAGGLATLLMDLLTPEDEARDARIGHLRFDTGLLAERLLAATEWLRQTSEAAELVPGYFGAMWWSPACVPAT